MSSTCFGNPGVHLQEDLPVDEPSGSKHVDDNNKILKTKILI